MQVNQPHVQLAVARTLVNDPNFQKLLRDENKVDDAVFYPVTARTGFEVTVRHCASSYSERSQAELHVCDVLMG